jgi:hypothetical protein
MHDVQFSVGSVIEDCYEDLQSKRIGWEGNCHIDSFLELKYVWWYAVVLSHDPVPETQEVKLYFVNAGWYKPDQFCEQHEIGFYVAKTSTEATQSALKVLCEWQDKRHRDDLYDVDDCIAIQTVRDYYVHLVPTQQTQDFLPMYYGYGLMSKNLSEKIVHQNY